MRRDTKQLETSQKNLIKYINSRGVDENDKTKNWEENEEQKENTK
mgnify:CR=1 FL=1